jgi:branched-subunit amino acid aminotransferase/4-amino-4-deoxychorismate lyase
MAPPGVSGPTWAMHTFPVAFHTFAKTYSTGQALVVSSIRQVPANCWPTHLKCRSRMHYYLADREARQRNPEARALLLDQEGFVTEASTANFLIYSADRGLVSPPLEKVLPGITLATLADLADGLSMPVRYQDITVDDAYAAEEAFLCSTSPCILPVSSIDGRKVGSGQPGPMFQRLLKAWSEHVGVDIQDQAERFSKSR